MQIYCKANVAEDYLSVQDAGGQFALHAAVVGRVHPQQELPASGERDGQRVEDFSGVDATGETVRKVIFMTTVLSKRHKKIGRCSKMIISNIDQSVKSIVCHR